MLNLQVFIFFVVPRGYYNPLTQPDEIDENKRQLQHHERIEKEKQKGKKNLINSNLLAKQTTRLKSCL